MFCSELKSPDKENNETSEEKLTSKKHGQIDLDNIREDKDNSENSFDSKLEKIYEMHKNTAPKINRRPISSYTSNRNFNTKGIEKEAIGKPKPQSAKAKALVRGNGSGNNCVKEDNHTEVTPMEIINDINQFMQEKKITKKEFMSNSNVFITLEDFIQTFKDIHYNVSSQYLRVLFENESAQKGDDYILMKTFVDKIKFYKGDINMTDLTYSYTETQKSQSKLTENEKENNSKSIYEIQKINNEYKKFNQDIIDILKNDLINNPSTSQFNNESTKMNKSSKMKSSSKFSSNNNFIRNNKKCFNQPMNVRSLLDEAEKIDKENSRKIKEKERKVKLKEGIKESEAIFYKEYIGTDIYNINMNLYKKSTNPESKIEPEKKSLTRDFANEKKIEEQKIRKALDKRNILKWKEFAYKTEECNSLCEALQINKKYEFVLNNGDPFVRVVDDERKGKRGGKEAVKAKREKSVSNNNAKKAKNNRSISVDDSVNYGDDYGRSYKIDLKKFIVEWRILYKKYREFNHSLMPGEDDEAIKALNNYDEDKYSFIEEKLKKKKKEQEEKVVKYNNIKGVLIEAIRLKTKLAEQYDNLKRPFYINENEVINHLLKAGLELPKQNSKSSVSLNEVKRPSKYESINRSNK